MLKTKIIIQNNTPIYALSDIHADIDALIIALRDCAGVIKKRKEFLHNTCDTCDTYGLVPTPHFSEINVRLQAGDAFLEHLLLLDMNNPVLEKTFNKNCDLGYEWCGGSSHVVIIGDILDGLRPDKGFISERGYQWSHQYYQIEVKILKFLNKLDEYACNSGGRVIKLLGNHECVNFTNPKLIKSYCFANTINQPVDRTNYYQNYSRLEYFTFNGPGFNLFRERGIAVLLVINDTIFVHGDFNDTIDYSDIVNINMMLNSYNGIFEHGVFEKFKKLTEPDGILMGRTSGNTHKINDRINDKQKMDTHCRQIDKYIDNFCNNNQICNKNKVRIILGHCIQSETNGISKNITISNIVGTNDRTVSYSAKTIDHIYTGPQDYDRKILFGISMECAQEDEINHKIYKIDVGLSRAFDIRNFVDIIKFAESNHRKKLLSMAIDKNVPQILKIKDDNVTIIKSLTRNTRLHQPRLWIEKLIHKYSEFKEFLPVYGYIQDTNSQIGAGQDAMFEKYMKYKSKYNSLKTKN